MPNQEAPESSYSKEMESKQALRFTYDLFLEALKELPALAAARGIKPSTIAEHYIK